MFVRHTYKSFPLLLFLTQRKLNTEFGIVSSTYNNREVVELARFKTIRKHVLLRTTSLDR